MGEKWSIDKNHPFDSVARIKEATLIVHETFLKYLKMFVPDEKETEELLRSLTSQVSERNDMQTNKNNRFYDDEVGFEHYCRVKYKKLYDHIIRYIDKMFAGQI